MITRRTVVLIDLRSGRDVFRMRRGLLRAHAASNPPFRWLTRIAGNGRALIDSGFCDADGTPIQLVGQFDSPQSGPGGRDLLAIHELRRKEQNRPPNRGRPEHCCSLQLADQRDPFLGCRFGPQPRPTKSKNCAMGPMAPYGSAIKAWPSGQIMAATPRRPWGPHAS